MRNKTDHWLYIEPYVHIIARKSTVLLYSSVTRKFWQFPESPEIITIVRKLIDPENDYVVKIDHNLIENSEVKKFIKDIRKNYLGDLLPVGNEAYKPFNIFPAPIVKKKAPRELKYHLREISFHITDLPDNTTKSITDGFYQLGLGGLSCRKGFRLPVEKIRHIVQQVTSLKALTLNFSGIPYQDEEYFSLINQIAINYPFQLRVFATAERAYRFTRDQMPRDAQLVVFMIPDKKKETLEFLEWMTKIESDQRNTEVQFIVRNTREVDMALKLLSEHPVKHFLFKPYYNGHNIDFFFDQVFTGIEDIALSRPGQNQVFSRKIMNDNDIGKINILPDGSVFANVNDPELGNVDNDSLAMIVEKEVTSGRSWFRNRTKVLPCSDCIYQFLCPPISNYELTLKRFNLCKIQD